MKSLIQRSDFVAGILPSVPSPNVVFELGLALGLGKPLLLFAYEPSSVPSDLASANFLPVSQLGGPTWGDYFDAFLRSVHPSKSSSKSPTPRKTNSNVRRWREIRTDYTELLKQRDHSFETDLEAIVERAFKLGGFSISRSPSPDFGADFALATPKLAKAFSLPILIEVKNTGHHAVVQETIDSLSSLIRDHRGGAGLIVTTKPNEAGPYLKGAEAIVIVAVLELFQWLQDGTFEQEFLSIVDAFWTREH